MYKDNFNKRELLDNIRFREALELFPKCRDNGRETSTQSKMNTKQWIASPKVQKNILININPFKLDCVANTISALFVFNVRCMFLEKRRSI